VDFTHVLIQEHLILELNVKLVVFRIQQHYLVLDSMEKQMLLKNSAILSDQCSGTVKYSVVIFQFV
jgi:hypothetical protein